jgi:hypothetical protein
VKILVARGSGDKIATDSGTTVDETANISAPKNWHRTLDF